VQSVPPSRPPIRFGIFEVDVRAGELRKQGLKIKLQEQPFQILQVLLERPGEVVTREELQQRIWPNNTFVDFDHGLYNAIKKLREALGDSADSPRYIETLARRGYRFIGPLNGASGGLSAAPTASQEASARLRPKYSKAATGFILSAMLLLGVLLALNPSKLREKLLNRNDAPTIRSLAVLPLQNLSGDPTQELFADAMTEELITELSRISALKVISRTSVMRYKKSDEALPEIARELNVDAVVEGSVLRSGDRVRISAQLIYAPKDMNLWAETYDRDLRDVLELQRTVASTIADQISAKMTPKEHALLRSPRPVSRKALDANLEGQQHLSESFNLSLQKSGGPERSAAEYWQARSSLQQAIQEDPSYAAAYLSLADAYQMDSMPEEFDRAKARELIKKAMTIDDTLPQAHLEMALILCVYDKNWTGAEKEYRRALEVSPNSADGHEQYARYLDRMGRTREGAVEHQTAQQLDPDTDHASDLGLSLADRVKRKRLYMVSHPTTPQDDWDLANLLYMAGLYPEAADEWAKVMRFFGWDDIAGEILSSGKLGPAGPPRALAKGIEEIAKHRWMPGNVPANVYAVMGDKNRAFAWLEVAYQQNDSTLLDLKTDPVWTSLRSDPRFDDLVRRVGLPQ
jgi:TolB-like protein/DNA-binding winged helix-turn-helix (wHTH) protein